MAWSDSPWNPKNWGSSSRSTGVKSSGSDAVSKKMDSDANATMPKNTALQDLQMDLGLIPKNDAYYRDLADRQARSAAALAGSNKSDKSTPAPAPKEEAPVEEAPAPVAPVTPVEDLTTQIQTVSDVVTKKTPQTKSTGPAEDAARAFEEKGRKSTILTSSQGLDEYQMMAPEERKKLRSRRSLLAG